MILPAGGLERKCLKKLEWELRNLMLSRTKMRMNLYQMRKGLMKMQMKATSGKNLLSKMTSKKNLQLKKRTDKKLQLMKRLMKNYQQMKT